jgi:Type II secretion system (T2SS), protein E, N-terminal domain
MTTTALSAIASAVTPRIRARRQPLLGGLLVKERLINQVQLDRVLALQQEMEPRRLLGQLLLDEKLLTPYELNAMLSKYDREHLLGDVLVDTNVITSAQLETALATQRRTNAPLGETLIRLGLITERQLKHALSIQLRIAFVDLDDQPIDPELASLISESYARHHQLMPIARANDRIVVAMADPTDAALVTELRSCTGRGIDVVTTTTDALERALARAYGARGDVPSPRSPRAETGEAATSAGHPSPDGRRSWERAGGSVKGLLGELQARQGEIARLETAYTALVQERETLLASLAELRDRHDALLRDRGFAIGRLEAALHRLRS